MEALAFTFETFGKDLEEGLEDRSQQPENKLLLKEMRVGCTLGMLLASIARMVLHLGRDSRLRQQGGSLHRKPFASDLNEHETTSFSS